MNQKPSFATFIRTFIFYFIFMGTIPITAFLMRFATFFKKRLDPWKIVKIWGRMLNRVLKTICKVNIVVHGKPDTDDSPAIVISNHTGPWETGCIMPFLPVNTTFVVKKQLLSWKYNFFGEGLKALKAIPISREANAGDFNIIRENSLEHFKEKHHVLIFPGGTRKALAESIDFPPTGVLLAKKLKCRIIPIFLDSERWARGKIIKDYGMIFPGDITLVYGDPISLEKISGTPVKEIHAQIMEFYKKEFQKLCDSKYRGQNT